MKTLKVDFGDINSTMRFDSKYHLSDGTVYFKKLREHPHTELAFLCSDIFTAGRSKRVYTGKKYGYPYLSNSDIVKQNPFESCKYNSKKYGYDELSFLKRGMIVTGRVGAIGQTTYMTSEFEEFKAMGSDNIIRIVPKDINQSSYIYTFLSSKYGNTLLCRLAAGGVQPYISEEMLGDIPIPIIQESIQKKIQILIVEAANLREDSNKLLNESEILFNELNELKYSEDLLAVSENALQTGYKVNVKDNLHLTIKAGNHSLRARKIIQIWNSKRGKLFKEWVDDEGLTRGMGGFFKRITDKRIKGMDIISQADLHDLRPTFKKVIKQDVKESEIATRGMIIMPAAGNASGEGEIFLRPQLVYRNFEGKILSEVIGKLRCRNLIDASYLYIALKSKAGFRILRAMKYGTSLRYPNWKLLKDINIPCIDDKCKILVSKKVVDSFNKRADALIMENQAIDLLEKEIESWQK